MFFSVLTLSMKITVKIKILRRQKMKKIHLTLITTALTAFFIAAVSFQPNDVKANDAIVRPSAAPTPSIVRPKGSRAGIPKAKVKTNKPNNFEWEGETTEVRTRNPKTVPAAAPKKKKSRNQ